VQLHTIYKIAEILEVEVRELLPLMSEVNKQAGSSLKHEEWLNLVSRKEPHAS
jgi:hypothetical protein